MMANLTITRRLWLAFGLLLVLLAAQAALGLLNVGRSGANVRTLMLSSDEASLAGDLQSRMASLRIEARNYLYSGDPRYVEGVQQQRRAIEQKLTDSAALIRATPHETLFSAFAAANDAYQRDFDRARQLRNDADTHRREQLAPAGERINGLFDALVDAAVATRDPDVIHQSEQAVKSWVLARLYVSRYIGLAEIDLEPAIDRNIAAMETFLRQTAALPAGAGLQDRITAVTAAIPTYRDGFRFAAGQMKEINRYRDEVMVAVGAKAAEAARAIVAAADTDQDALGTAAADDARFSVILTAVIALVSLVAGLWAAAAIARSIVRPLDAVKQSMEALTDGHLTVTVPHTGDRDEVGAMARAVAAFKDESVEALRSRIALDAVSANIMMADTDGTVRYANRAITAMFTEAQADIRKEIRSFDAQALTGMNFDAFHKDAARIHRMVDSLSGSHAARIVIGGRTLAITLSPVIGRHGDRLGTVVEWKDLTAELAIEREISDMVGAAVQGDFSRRINLAGKAGFARTVSDGINQLAQNVSEVAEELASLLESLSQGDLSRRIDKRYEGVFNRLKEDFNATVDKLSVIVRRINQASDAIGQASREVADGSLDLSERTEQQASSLEETAASMEQMAATVRSNADNAQQVNVFAADARKAARRGGDVAASAVEAMRRIERSSQKISDIIGVIDEIAFQTNLLALNAAVEAARAGDAGRGFAVVAQEVRNLAQRSAQASKEIKALILDSGAQVRDGVDLVTSAGDTLTGIVDGITRVADLVAEIARATTEQAGGLDEINNAVAQMDEMTQKNAALVEESTAAARSLEEQAHNLREQMTFFALDAAAAQGRGSSDLSRHVQLIENTKIDHVTFLENVTNAIAGHGDATAAGLSDHHHCRLGKWYDTVTDATVRSSPHFTALLDPHASFHDLGRRALTAHEAGEADEAKRLLGELEALSRTVLTHLDELAADVRARMRRQAA
ncbi:methyl-accepting chemotaxis protein [Azospirillum fermentarium]|uniref:methyl-accepting chemotaxis protein n=1 Tax=Azospirillum fermentarium TaxID=1233114 RepID=UPI00222667D8|nr:methyl-accepting chemotaxis protein [Azospirillum fermentarium]MCW2245483.1 methyl-accepting chemotaxis protein [Azospirillum fermentarium]